MEVQIIVTGQTGKGVLCNFYSNETTGYEHQQMLLFPHLSRETTSDLQ